MNMDMFLPRKYTLKDDQQGFASIVIALIMILVLSLLTIGFAQLARREQQNALDKQLATQAQYAAESGINDAYSDIKNQIITSSSSGCLPPTTSGMTASPTVARTINAVDDVSYTCLKVNLTPPAMQYTGSDGTQNYTSFSTTQPLTSLTIQWGSSDSKTSYPTTVPSSSQQFPTHNQWASLNQPPVIQLSLTPLNSLTRSGLMDNTFTAYLYPSKALQNPNPYSYSLGIGAANGDGSTFGDAPVISGGCSSSGGATPCSVTIGGFNTVSGSPIPYLMRIGYLYDNATVNVNAGGVNDFVNGLATIDATGKAKNVLKRLVVNVPIAANAPANQSLPGNAVDGQNICKRLQTSLQSTTVITPSGYPGAGTTSDPCTFPYGTGSAVF